MTALQWSRTAEPKVTIRACEPCRATGRPGKGKATWFPVIAGYWLPSEDPLGHRYGMCQKCRDEWNDIWQRKGLA